MRHLWKFSLKLGYGELAGNSKPFICKEDEEIGGDEGDRTPDLCNAIAALSQLSYVPEIS